MTVRVRSSSPGHRCAYVRSVITAAARPRTVFFKPGRVIRGSDFPCSAKAPQVLTVIGSRRLQLCASPWRRPGESGLPGLPLSHPQSESKSGWLEYSLAISFSTRHGVVDSFGQVPQRVTYSSGRLPPDWTTIVRSLWRSTCARRRTVSTLASSARRARRNVVMFTLGNYP